MERKKMAMKVPGPAPANQGALLTNATAVHPDWYRPINTVAPAWDKWCNMAAVELWQAIALSCGIEPTYNPQGADRDFDERMDIAKSHMLPGGRLQATAIDPIRPHCSLVRLVDVASLAASCTPPWTLPAGFPTTVARAAIDQAEVKSGEDDVQPQSGSRPKQRQQFQEEEILRVIAELGYDAKSLPKYKAGAVSKGVKAKVREELTFSNKVFDLAWERLRLGGAIKDAKSPSS